MKFIDEAEQRRTVFTGFSDSLSGDGNAWVGVFAVLGMAVLGLGLVGVGKWFARNDEAWLSNVIQRALRREPR